MRKTMFVLLLSSGLLFAMPSVPASANSIWANYTQWMPEEQTILLLREVWDAQTFDEMQAGHVIVTDQVMNVFLAENATKNSKIEAIRFASQANGRIKLEVTTHALGRVKIIGVIEEFHHDANSSSLTFRVLNKRLMDKPLVSWIFSQVSLAMLSTLYGNPAAGTDLLVEIKGNTVTANFHDYLYTTRVGQVNLFGHRLIEEVQVTGAQPKEGYVILDTNLALVPELAAALPGFLHGS